MHDIYSLFQNSDGRKHGIGTKAQAPRQAEQGRNEKILETAGLQGFFLVDDTRLELVTSRTSSNEITSFATRPTQKPVKWL
ncbi:MAG: hypothetical protein E7472_01015 [Ruminococcaceae bacterium]|nr:hypothetical protein [Oscillospiraceae bacterium]